MSAPDEIVCDCGALVLDVGQRQEVIPILGRGEEVHREPGSGFPVCYRQDGEQITWYQPFPFRFTRP